MSEAPQSSPPLIRPRAIIFDWDNTLIDSWAVIRDALNATFDEFGLERWSLEQTRQRVAKSMRDSFPGLFGDDWERAGEVFYGHFAEMHLERLTPLAGAGEALGELADAGFALGVVSNKTGRLLRLEAEKLGWDRHFTNIIGAGDAERDKPAPDPVALALDGSGIEMGLDVWFAGDAAIDLECAQNARCVPVLVRETPPGENEFGPLQPRLHFATAQMLSNHAKNM